MLFSLPFQDIRFADIQALLADGGYPESDYVEYKEFVPGRSGPDNWHKDQKGVADYGRDKILAEIVAFANTHGGHLIIGIQESDDKPKRAIGISSIPACADLADRLRQAAFAAIEPRLANLQVRGVSDNAGGGGVVVVRVPRSQSAPHRLMSNLECYVRRGDSTERMTMIEIQDLTLNATRGLDAVERRLREYEQEFDQRFTRSFGGRPTLSRIGLFCTAVPLQPLGLTRADVEASAPTIRRSFIAHRSSYGDSYHLPISGYNSRPILRGAMIANSAPSFAYEHALREDGSQSAFVLHEGRYNDKQLLEPASLYGSWIMGLAASVLHQSIDLARRAANPGLEFAVRLALRGEGLYQVAVAAPGKTFDGQPLQTQLPTYAFLPDQGLAPVLNTMLGDVLNDQGEHHHDEVLQVVPQ